MAVKVNTIFSKVSIIACKRLVARSENLGLSIMPYSGCWFYPPVFHLYIWQIFSSKNSHTPWSTNISLENDRLLVGFSIYDSWWGTFWRSTPFMCCQCCFRINWNRWIVCILKAIRGSGMKARKCAAPCGPCPRRLSYLSWYSGFSYALCSSIISLAVPFDLTNMPPVFQSLAELVVYLLYWWYM